MSTWTLHFSVFDIETTEENIGIEVFDEDSGKTVFLKSAMIDFEEPENIVNWFSGEPINGVELSIITINGQKILRATCYDIDYAIRLRTSFGDYVRVVL